MVKIFGLRITPFFLFILGLEFLALLLSIYLGLLLYQNTLDFVSLESFDQTIHSSFILFVMLLILTPGFFSQVKIIKKIKKSIIQLAVCIGVSVMIMSVIMFSNFSNLSSKTIFIAALLSACIGLSLSQLSVIGKYWRFLIRSGVN